MSQQLTQHNALVNASFSLLPVQMRLFMSLLSRTNFTDELMQEQFIPCAELVSGRGGTAYNSIREACEGITGVRVYIEQLEGASRRRTRTSYTFLNLMSFASYDAVRHGVVAKFNFDVRPYLLQLHECGNYTRTTFEQIRKLKSPYSVRIYWLLKEYSDFGHRTIDLAQLRQMLSIGPEQYQKMSHFTSRVLDKAQTEISHTDIPFTYELRRKGAAVEQIKFDFPSTAVLARAAPQAGSDEPAWALQLLALGLSQRTVEVVGGQIKTGGYDEGYVSYVLRRVKTSHQNGRIKTPAGAIRSALVNAYWVADYRQQRRPAALPVAAAASPLLERPEISCWPLEEIRYMHEHPEQLPEFLRRQKPADETFEQYLARAYPAPRYEVIARQGKQWIVEYGR